MVAGIKQDRFVEVNGGSKRREGLSNHYFLWQGIFIASGNGIRTVAV